jgi:hypothetical protein
MYNQFIKSIIKRNLIYFLLITIQSFTFLSCSEKFEVNSNKALTSSDVSTILPGLDSDKNTDESLQKVKVGLNQSELVFTEGSIALLSLELEEKHTKPVKILIHGISENEDSIEQRFINFQN